MTTRAMPSRRDEEAEHRRFAAEAPRLDGLPATAFYYRLSIAELQRLTGQLNPGEIADEAALTPRERRRLRLWHAAWVALEAKEAERDERRQRADVRRRERGLALAASLRP